MTQEDIQLLFEDLSSRLPAKVIVRTKIFNKYCDTVLENISIGQRTGEIYAEGSPIKYCKPYLRPISSMTQGEWEEMTAIIYPHGRVNRNPDNKDELLLWLSTEGNEMPISLMERVFKWLIYHHFDFRGMIEKGLALKATKEMYKI